MASSGVNGVRRNWRWCAFVFIAVLGAITDLWTKSWIFNWLGLPNAADHEVFWIVKPYFGLETAVNPGAVFGLGAGFGMLFAAFSVLATIGILVWLAKFGAIESRWLVVSLGMVQGGIVGNLYDRLGLWNPPKEIPQWSSGVRDWIRFSYGEFTWPNFNIADSLLVCGAVMLATHSFFMTSPKKESEKAE